MRIEKEKAAERQKAGKAIDPTLKSAEGGEAAALTAKQFGIGKDTMKKEMQIVENKDLLTPEDFADWDEGKLSTKKTYKTAQKPCTAAFPSKVHRCTRNSQVPTQGQETRL